MPDTTSTKACDNCGSNHVEPIDGSEFVVCKACRTVYHTGKPQQFPTPSSFVMNLSDASPPLGYRDGPREASFSLSWRIDSGLLGRGASMCFSIFIGFWMTLVLIGAFGAMNSGSGEGSSALFVMAAFGAMFAIPMIPTTIAAWTGRSLLTIRDATLRVRLAPLPWTPEKVIPVADIDRFSCSEMTADENTTYSVDVRLRSGEIEHLVPKLARPVTAAFIQQRLEEFFAMRAGAGRTVGEVMNEVVQSRP